MYNFKVFTSLPKDAMEIREEVFVFEQGFVDEFDEVDQTSLHFLIYEDDFPIGTARVFKDGDKIHIGRFAVRKDYRGHRVGSSLMRYIEKEILYRFGHSELILGSQEQAVPFYKSVGFIETSDRYIEQDCPHVTMAKKI